MVVSLSHVCVVFDYENTVFNSIKTGSYPLTVFMRSSYSACHHLSVMWEYSLINKGKSLDPNLNIVKGKAALFDIFFPRHALIFVMAFTSSGISIVCQLSS